MRLAVDIDGTLNDADTWALVLAKRFAKKHGIKIKLNLEAFDYSDKFFGGDKKAESLFLKECGDVYVEDIPMRANADKVLKKLKDEGDEIYIITARHKVTRKDAEGEKVRWQTENWLKKNNIVYDKLIYTKSNASKEEVFLQNNCDLLIDDKILHIKAVAKHKSAICFREVYNKELKQGKNIYICKSWKQIYKTIEKIRKQARI